MSLSASPSPSQAWPEGVPNLCGLRVLVADDEPLIRDLLSELLRKTGCLVTLARDGVEAVEAWCAERPHVVLMDGRMPLLDGFQATTRIRVLEGLGACRHTQILSISSSLTKGQETFAQAYGFDGILGKPFKVEELWTVLTRLAADHD